MQTDLTITVGSVLLAILLLAFLWVLGVGVLPLLKAWQGLVEEKRVNVRKTVEGIEARFAADPDSIVTSTVHGIASRVQFDPGESIMVGLTGVINEGLKMGYKILKETPDTVTAEEVADAADKVADFITRLTDAVPGNALPPIEEYLAKRE